jgi:heterodisulfide reductase subunit C
MTKETLHPDYQFLGELESAGPFQAQACFQCRKCTNGCPVTFAMDLLPDEVIRMVILGQREQVLSCRTIWVCAACETCTTRCPNMVMIAELMDHLKTMAIEAGIPCPQPQILSLHETFLKNVSKRGRVFEASFLATYLLRSGELVRKWKDGTWRPEVKLGWEMMAKGRMPLLPGKRQGQKEVRRILSGRGKRKKVS